MWVLESDVPFSCPFLNRSFQWSPCYLTFFKCSFALAFVFLPLMWRPRKKEITAEQCNWSLIVNFAPCLLGTVEFYVLFCWCLLLLNTSNTSTKNYTIIHKKILCSGTTRHWNCHQSHEIWQERTNQFQANLTIITNFSSIFRIAWCTTFIWMG